MSGHLVWLIRSEFCPIITQFRLIDSTDKFSVCDRQPDVEARGGCLSDTSGRDFVWSPVEDIGQSLSAGVLLAARLVSLWEK